MHCDSKRDAKTDGTFYVIHNSPIWSADMAAEEEGERLPIRQVAPQIARVFLEIACQYPNAAKALRRYYRTSLILTLRQLENFVVTRVSRAAQKKADEMGVGDLRQYKYSKQETRMKDRNRKIFHFEHIVPNSDMATLITNLKQPTLDGVTEIMMSAGVAWILKEEDLRLKRNDRADPLNAYKEAGIELLD
jgi:hypothetical protein